MPLGPEDSQIQRDSSMTYKILLHKDIDCPLIFPLNSTMVKKWPNNT